MELPRELGRNPPWLEFPWLAGDEAAWSFGVFVLVDLVLVVAPAVSAHAPSVSPCATCASTAGRAILIVCVFPEPVSWQISTFSCPRPSPAVEVGCASAVPPVA
ncbi:MAG TPA: hypothetical protein VNR63_03125 [Gaiellaceae bacterium]|nr:hypothetical protein [Gaiellaceae bacterium]